MKNKNVIVYWVVTGLFSLYLGFSGVMYIVQHDMAAEAFGELGFPVFIIYPLAIAKLLGITAIVTNKSKMLKEWAYAGFTFELLLASGAHINADHGSFAAPLVGLVLLWVSYFFYRRNEQVYES